MASCSQNTGGLFITPYYKGFVNDSCHCAWTRQSQKCLAKWLASRRMCQARPSARRFSQLATLQQRRRTGPAKNLSAIPRVSSLPRTRTCLRFHPPQTDDFRTRDSHHQSGILWSISFPLPSSSVVGTTPSFDYIHHTQTALLALPPIRRPQWPERLALARTTPFRNHPTVG